MGDYGLIAAITGIFCVVCGVFAARLAHKSYALVVAGTYLLQMLALGIVASAVMGIEITMWHFIVPTILAFIVFLTAKLTFLWLWGTLSLVGIILLGLIGSMVSADNIANVVNVKTLVLTYILALIGAIILRKHGRVLVVAITSGYNVGIGAVLMMMLAIDISDLSTIVLLMMAALVLLGVAGGIYYQYRIDRRLLDGLAIK